MFPRARTTRRHGFTLIEAMSSVLVLAVLGSVSGTLIVTAVDGYIEAATAAQIGAEASIALDRIAREIRGIRRDETAPTNPAPDIIHVKHIAPTCSLRWEDSGGDVYELTSAGTDVTLAYNGGAAEVLLSDVVTFAIWCYDEDNTIIAGFVHTDPDTDLDDIRRIMVAFTITRQGVSQTFQSKFYIRSMMDGAG